MFAAFSGTPFTVTADGTSLNTPSNQQNADLVGDVQRARQHRRRPASGSTPPRSRSRPACGSATRTATSSTVPAATTSTSRSSARSRSAGTRRLEFRVEAGNILNHAVYANPQGNLTSATFGQITGVERELPGAAGPAGPARSVLDAGIRAHLRRARRTFAAPLFSSAELRPSDSPTPLPRVRSFAYNPVGCLA